MHVKRAPVIHFFGLYCIYYKVIHARLKRRILLHFFFCASRRTQENCNITVLSLLNPGCRLSPLASRFRIFFDVRVAKSELSRRVLSFSFSLSLPLYSLNESRSGAVLSSCARTFKWRASTLKKAVPQPFGLAMRTWVGEKRAAAMHNFTESRAGDCLGDERNRVRKKTKEERVQGNGK